MMVMLRIFASSGKACHMHDGIGDVSDIHPGLGRDASIRLQDAAAHAFGKRGRGVADIDLAAGDLSALPARSIW